MNKGIQKIFSEISEKYEFINHIITFGFDIYWRRKTAKTASKNGGEYLLDVCTGTGEMAEYLKKFSNNAKKVLGLDFCVRMLEKAKSKRGMNGISFVAGDAINLPFKDKTIDLIIISFATRNLNFKRENLIKSLREFRQVLKDGGKFYNLETGQPDSRIIRWVFHFYVKKIAKKIGSAISRSKSAYAYLSHTIPEFYEAEKFKKILLEAGFLRVEIKKFLFGIVTLHIAEK
ncbi:MAG: ubiquinone/menaquinone biosynthesis methyltransferase [Candidatus Aminicenantia bacterium]